MNIVVPDKSQSEEMDIIVRNLKTRGVETSLENAAKSWGAIQEARKDNDLLLLRAYDVCYSARYKPALIKTAALALRRTGNDEHEVTLEGLASYQLVLNALYRNETDLPLNITLPQREELLVLAIVKPTYGEGISRLISERGMIDVSQVRSIIELASEHAPAVSSGAL
jgi:hypothetical protein